MVHQLIFIAGIGLRHAVLLGTISQAPVTKT